MKLLVVEDEPKTGDYLRQGLVEAGFVVDLARDGVDGLHLGETGDYDLAILDVMLPKLDGWQVLAGLRRAGRDMPVLFLTARDQVEDRVKGLELGADDYVPKPCSPRELVARLRAILRRVADNSGEGKADGPIVVGPLRMWPERRSAQWQEQPLELTSTEYSLLEVLARHAGRVVSKGDLSELAMGRPLARFDRSIDVHVSSIRQKLGARDNGDSWIQTIRGQGYQLVKA